MAATPAAAAAAPIEVLCMATADGRCDFKPATFKRRAVGPRDVLIGMRYCGVCHSDLTNATGDMTNVVAARYPCVPGHELSGVVEAVGAEVTKFKVGDAAGVGCMVDSCLTCSQCQAGEEQFCKKGSTSTYGGADKHGRAGVPPGGPQHTLGGYTTKTVVDERFAIKIPAGYPLEAAGPVMCSGVTLYDPLKRHAVGPGSRVGIIGLGGLGVIGIKIAKAMGAHVTAITRSKAKGDLATRAGADRIVLSSDAGEMKAAAGSLDLLLNTIPVEHDYLEYNVLLDKSKRAAKHVIIGLNPGLIGAYVASGITCGRSRLAPSMIGGIPATQEVIDLCAKHNILPEITVVPVHEVNRVYTALDASNDAGVRYVLDLSTLNADTAAKCEGVPPPTLSARHPIRVGAILATLGSFLFSWRA